MEKNNDNPKSFLLPVLFLLMDCLSVPIHTFNFESINPKRIEKEETFNPKTAKKSCQKKHPLSRVKQTFHLVRRCLPKNNEEKKIKSKNKQTRIKIKMRVLFKLQTNKQSINMRNKQRVVV